ncbi:MAG: gephyrin-like molybdotransferase Glp [Hyphomonadaceae bacterium]
MITLAEARAIVLDALMPVGMAQVPLDDVHGRTLAKSLIAQRTQPPFSSSAMDGFAVRGGDLGDGPTSLQIIGESAAGHPSDLVVGEGEAARISTGAPMPNGADQVVMREDATCEGDVVTVDCPANSGRHVRAAGVDFETGDELAEAGRVIDALVLSLAVSSGVQDVEVRNVPHVALLSTGDELVEAGEVLGDGQIINSNGPGLAAMVRELGGEPIALGIIPDDREAVRNALTGEQVKAADLLITIGGASVGDHDHLRAVFAEEGGTLLFEKIAVKPGKPTWFGHMGDTPVLGLPGNPVSALVIARLLLVPALAQLLGQGPETQATYARARLGTDLPANGPREIFIRANLETNPAGRQTVSPLTNQDSSALSALVRADCLIRRAGDAPYLSAGDHVEIVHLRSSKT